MSGNVGGLNPQIQSQLQGLARGMDVSRDGKLRGSEVTLFKESAQNLGIDAQTVEQFLHGIRAQEGSDKERTKMDVENFKSGKSADVGRTSRNVKNKTIALQQQCMRDLIATVNNAEPDVKAAVLSQMTSMPRPNGDLSEYKQSLENWANTILLQAGQAKIQLQNDVTHDNQQAISEQIDEQTAHLDESIKQDGDATRTVVKQEGQETRKEVQRQGAITRRTVRQEGAATRRTVQQEGAATREAVHQEGAATRAEVRRQGRITRQVVHQEGADVRMHTFNEASVSRLHSTFISELNQNSHFNSTKRDLASIANLAMNSRCSLEDKMNFMNKLINYERKNYIFNASELAALRKEAQALVDGPQYEP